MWTRMNLWAWILTGAFGKLISNILGIFESRLHDSGNMFGFFREKNFLQFSETRMGDSWLDLTQFYSKAQWGDIFFFSIIFVRLRYHEMSSIFNLKRNFFIKCILLQKIFYPVFVVSSTYTDFLRQSKKISHFSLWRK